MPYEKMAGIIEAHKIEVSRMVINEMETKNLLSGELSREQLYRIITPVIMRFAQYLLDGDVVTLRDFIKQMAQGQMEKGNPSNNIMQAGRIIFDKLRLIIERELPGPENELYRQMYYRRIEGVNTLGIAAITNADVKKRTSIND